MMSKARFLKSRGANSFAHHPTQTQMSSYRVSDSGLGKSQQSLNPTLPPETTLSGEQGGNQGETSRQTRLELPSPVASTRVNESEEESEEERIASTMVKIHPSPGRV
jgi:hypothetical protein